MTADAEAEYRYLQTPRAIRERSRSIFELAQRGELLHWSLDERRLPEVAARVVRVTRELYPDPRDIPYHSRWRHFDVGGVPRIAAFERRLGGLSADEQLMARFELAITSVLLDAGAGPGWHYREPGGGVYRRSEGLAVASYELFMSGALSSTPGELLADAEGLQGLSEARLSAAFQVEDANPLTGVAGRAALLRRLGEAVAGTPKYFGGARPRLGQLALFLRTGARGSQLSAGDVLSAVLEALGPIWPGRERLAGKSLGDVWRHSSAGWLPFHKLSQWLSYSLLEPLEAAGLVIDGIDELTGLAEYRNGGLFVDAGVIALRDGAAREARHPVGSDLVIEWRALTLALLDRTAVEVRGLLGLSESELPLARVLEGGTWRAGREIAAEQRDGARPPLNIDSDGTVF